MPVPLTPAELRATISLVAFAAAHGYRKHAAKSTAKYPLIQIGDGVYAIVTHGRTGDLYRVQNDDANRGSVVDFAMRVIGLSYHDALRTLREFAASNGIAATPPAPREPAPAPVFSPEPFSRMSPGPSRYLRDVRRIPDAVQILFLDAFRVDARHFHNVCFPHHRADGSLCGWEVKNAKYHGFCEAGERTLWRHTIPAADGQVHQIIICETVIDAMSYAALHDCTPAIYVSTGGTPSKAGAVQVAALLAQHPGAELITATDADAPGDAFAAQLAKLTPCCTRHRPPGGQDWNDVLRASTREPAIS